MKTKDTLWHISWGEGEDAFVIAPTEKIAKKRMTEGKGMIKRIVRLDALYQMIFKAGAREARLQLKAKIGGIDEFTDWSDEGLRQFRRMTLQATRDLLEE